MFGKKLKIFFKEKRKCTFPLISYLTKDAYLADGPTLRTHGISSEKCPEHSASPIISYEGQPLQKGAEFIETVV